ncbi:glycosyl hydrolase [Streptomyces sp. NBC_01142]|uniref:glycosyl hydrolase n=1 Tax=Streptomyces sp. NBC_01142 TaxID=2975865 RepID=UPI00224D5A3B|nr:glycosyl hydrolase [Streptomyces sp. NBC_01142]MCX4825296.1 glycosyl hydrolase [Streptomyces sp. NBC_01142]
MSVDPCPLPASIAAILAEPPHAFSPTAIWWWSGERLGRARLRAQLERFVDGGVYNLVLLNLAPSGPLFGSDADDPAFLSDTWWALLHGVCDDARELGVSLWFYDQLGFSGADLQARLVDQQPAHAGRRLERVRTVVDSRGELRCPEQGQPLAAHAEPVDRDDRPVGPAVPLVADDPVVRTPGPGRWRLTLHHHVPLGFDYLGADACEALLDRVHGEFERRLGDRLGSVVVGSFQDELPALPTWSNRFAEAFLRRRGYDLTGCLGALYDDSTHPDTHRIRRDYHLTRAELAEEAFFRPLAAWHDRHGLIVGCDQQDPARAGHPVAGVELYADYARTHRWFSAPGSDHHGDARIHSSLAHLYGRPRTWIEAFHSTGWGGTLEETFDWLLPWLRAGATLYNPHAVYYTTKGGWWEWAPPATDWRQPYWRHHRVFADAVTRLCAILSLGRHLCDIAILLPTTTVQSGAALDGVTAAAARAQATYLELVGDMAWFRTRPGVVDRLGLDADVIDDASLSRAHVRGADAGGDVRLCVADEGYATIVLPACTVLEQDTARSLVAFASAGGHVIALGVLPELVVGPDGAATLDELRACFGDGRALFVPATDASAEALSEALSDALSEPHPAVRASVPALARRVDDATVVFLTAASPRATRASVAAPDERGAALGWLDVRYDFDPDRYARTARVRVRDVAGPAVLLDPFGGEPRTVAVRPAKDDSRAVEVDVPFDTGPAAVLVFPGGRGEAPIEAAAEPAVAVVVIPADAEWDMTLVPTLDDTWGDFARPATGPPAGPHAPVETECRTFRHRVEEPGEDGVRDGWAEPGRAAEPSGATVHATFGPRAIVLGAGAGDDIRSTLEWSETRGVHKDPVHRAVLGPKGHVPEEFLHIGPTGAGEVARVRVELLLDEAFEGHLAVGAAAAKTARIGGVPVALDDGGHLAMGPVRAEAGRHLLELDLIVHQKVDLRAHLALVRRPERYRRPEWILPAGRDGTVGTTLTLAELPARAVVQIAARGSCVLRVNGRVVGRQGGFDPYVAHAVPRVRRHDVTAALRTGENDITVETVPGDDPAVLVDAILYDGKGGHVATVHSDALWWTERAGGRAPVVVRREQAGDPAALYLRRRPHPLPGAAWLDPDADDGTVVPVGFAVPGGRAAVEWLWCELPPGTRQLTLDVHGDTTVFVDGHERPATTGTVCGGVRTLTVDVSADGPCGTRTAALRMQTRPGHQGGAALAGPLRCVVGPGRIRVGSWEKRGLAEYSGGVRYSRVVTLPADVATGRLSLDLGRVRGTAEVRVGGLAAGVRVCSPYVFDVTGLAVPGANTVEITVFGTLAPHLDASSPTHFVFPGQRVTGLMGPVRLWAQVGATS